MPSWRWAGRRGARRARPSRACYHRARALCVTTRPCVSRPSSTWCVRKQCVTAVSITPLLGDALPRQGLCMFVATGGGDHALASSLFVQQEVTMHLPAACLCNRSHLLLCATGGGNHAPASRDRRLHRFLRLARARDGLRRDVPRPRQRAAPQLARPPPTESQHAAPQLHQCIEWLLLMCAVLLQCAVSACLTGHA